jgi:RNA polymerase sigma-70 factor (ECF subfamily)
MRQRVERSPGSPGSHNAGSSEKPDADLIAEMHAPNSDALGALFERYTRLVHRVAVGILRDEGEAEDVTQEVFFEIYRKSHQYDPSRGAVRVWLLQYAYHRSLRRKDALRRRAAYGGEPLEDNAENAVQSQGHRRGLTRQEARWVVRTGLTQLTERQRTTVELACLEEVSLHDVAERLRVSLGCARHYYYRGLARLRAWAQLAAGSGAGTASPVTHPVRRAPKPPGPEPRVAERSRRTRASRRGAESGPRGS